ncbi:gluconolaconase [Luteimonas terrae]|uniref:Sugar lactone lactonase YvrE n=1 Tax=Luteimonas terrae TaxID=1530191 RepID=A0ABU1XTA8_9GAMM|nr:gluconolaconase [Luteimonas terrae]MDR7191965.1 sugar lactone lactonase YvrE [Luteimonas terrae]
MSRRLRPGARWALWGIAALTVAALVASFLWEWRTSERPDLGPPPAGLPARIEHVTGDGHRGARDGARAEARFDDPFGIVVAPDRTAFVADGGASNRIRRVHIDGRVDTFAGSLEGFVDGRGADARFHTPSGLAIDTSGVLYVADTGNHAIRRIAPDGTVTTLAGTGEAGFVDGPAAQARFHAPTGVAVDAMDRVFVADGFNDRIRVIEAGTVRTLAGDGRPGFVDGPGAQARFDTPGGLAFDATGALWIADTGNHALRRIAPDGTTTTLALHGDEPDAAPVSPVSIALDAQQRLYVGELAQGRVLQIEADGRARVLTGRDMAQRLARPAGLAFDRFGRLWVADAAAYRVHRIAQVRRAGAKQNLLNVAVGPAPDTALPETRGRWPLAPQEGWHEVVGTLGEVRGNFRGESRSHLHAGFDVRGDVGSPVLAIADAKVASPYAASGFGDQAEHLTIDDVTYMHMRVGRTPRGEALDPRFQLIAGDDGRPMRVRIPRGMHVRAGDAIGTINAQAHVHLVVGPSGYQRNAVALGFRNFVDTVAPRIDAIELRDALDAPLTTRENGRIVVPRASGGLQIVVEAWDQVDGNLARRRLGLHALGYQILTADGTPASGFEVPRMTIVFDRMPPHREAVRVAYAGDSGITVHGAARTRFRYVVTNTVRDGRLEPGLWDAAALPAGDYIVRITARDASGNAALANRDLAVTLQ